MTTTEYAIVFTYKGHPGGEALIDADEALVFADGAVSAAPDDQVTVTVWTTADHPLYAAEAADSYLMKADVATRLGSPPLIGVEVVHGDEYVRRAETSTLPELIGATEAAGILKVTRQPHLDPRPQPATTATAHPSRAHDRRCDQTPIDGG